MCPGHSVRPLRKQCDGLMHAIITTGQESPETENRMREDVYKRHITADPVSCRSPYAILTRMVTLKGWKRYEMNDTLRFQGTSEASFESVFRRSLVILHKARFVSPQTMQAMFPKGDGAAHGYFLKDPSLRDFLASPRAGRALIAMLLGFAAQTSTADCQAILDDWAEGGDGGITWQVMRRACNLNAQVPPPPRATASTPPIGNGMVGPPGEVSSMGVAPPDSQASDAGMVCARGPLTSVQAVVSTSVQAVVSRGGEERAVQAYESVESRDIPRFLNPEGLSLQQSFAELVMFCLTARRDLLTGDLVRKSGAELWPSLSSRKKVQQYEALVAQGLLKVLPNRGQMKNPSIPVIHAKKTVCQLLPCPDDVSAGYKYQEAVSGDALASYMRNTSRMENDACILRYLWEQVSDAEAVLPGRGASSLLQRMAVEDARRSARKFQQQTDAIGHLVREVQGVTRSMTDVVSSPTGSCVFLHRFYSYKFSVLGRRYVAGGGMQACSRRSRCVLLPRGVVDLDIKNAMVSIVSQVVPKLDLGGLWPESVMSAWDEYRRRGDALRREIHEKLGVPAKPLLLGIAHGASPPETSDPELNKWMEQLSRDSRFLRWLAVAQLPELHASFLSTRPWPENTVFAYWWQTMEDRILASLVSFATSKGEEMPAHLSLHFDGLMLLGEKFVEGTPFKKEAEWFVEQHCGVQVDLVYKRHQSFLQLVSAEAAVAEGAATQFDVQSWPGRKCGIPFHLAVVTGQWHAIDEACRGASGSQVSALDSYRAWSDFLRRSSVSGEEQLLPHRGLVFPPELPGPFLLHTVDDTKPVCVALLPTGSDEYKVVYGDASSVATRHQLLGWFEAATDASVLVSFHVCKMNREDDHVLLGLKAGS